MAMGIDQRGIMAGKLKLAPSQRQSLRQTEKGREYTDGQMAAPTPKGTRLVNVSMSLDTSSLSPMMSVGMAQAASTTWDGEPD